MEYKGKIYQEIKGNTTASGVFYNLKSKALEVWQDGQKWAHSYIELVDDEQATKWVELMAYDGWKKYVEQMKKEEKSQEPRF